MLFSISDNICLSYPCGNHCFYDLDFSGLGNQIRGGIHGAFSYCAVQKLMLHSHGGIVIWDNDELSFQVAQGIKSKKRDCKKGATENSQRPAAFWKHHE